MKILHYTLGFPPYRSGGLVKYVSDLIQEQKKNIENTVFVLYPGKVNLFRKSSYIKKVSNFNFELVNSLPLAIFGGIKKPADFMKKVNIEIYKSFLLQTTPDVIHVHTLMGLHREFFEAATELGIKVVYTTHDYYGISPIPTFFYNGNSYDCDNDNISWNLMSANALSTYKLRVQQTVLYPLIKKIKINKIDDSRLRTQVENVKEIKDYTFIRNYYMSIFNRINTIHFNSTISKQVFEKNIPLNIRNSIVLNLSNSSVKQKDVTVKKNNLKTIAYIGPYNHQKGFFEFLKLTKEDINKDYEFLVLGDNTKIKLNSNVKNLGKFSEANRARKLKDIDLIIVPSLWKETYGFIVLESLSMGIPVFVSQTVGAKDLLGNDNIMSDFSLKNIIMKYNNLDNNKYRLPTMAEHTQDVINKLYLGESNINE